ncbi:T9SS type A sorting domain-containing protein [Kaistella jeonii]|uniref:Secretion system C-terminal sorting domain-containing protein n=1 Tax=Kaistella jeonii TaxID=266749 RepID=A0A0C1FB92_9FLAO|nr:T9SS type A sorting domain-containing protein [Kaistella jeonii]KIA89138.1 hypothetical protein OA86_08745 [Kaistella jeonii]SFB93485.1 Por secretion system C-terminal sorting domain-containing protein [Kaistella jeonii]VEI97045.1 Por secretion system C-terminal sorting domain [Kaistella jeonii]
MKKKYFIFRKSWIVLLLLISAFAFAQTNTWDGSKSNNWDDYRNWSLNLVPNSAHDVVIPNNYTVTVNTAAVCKTLVINSGNNSNAITINTGKSLNVSGLVTIGAGTGSGDNKLINVGANIFSCGSINITATGSNNRNSGITLSTGTVTVAGNVAMGDVNDFVKFTGAGLLRVGGDMSSGTLIPSTGTVEYNGNSEQALESYTYYNLLISEIGNKNSTGTAFSVANDLTISKGNLILTATDANYNIGNNLAVANTGTLTHNVNWDSAGKLLLVGGNLTIDGAFSYSGVARSHLQMNTGGKTIKTGTAALSILTMNNTTGIISAVGPVVINDNFWPSFNVSGGTFATGSNTVTANGGVLVAGGTLLVNGGTLNVTGGLNVGYDLAASGTLNLDSGIINTDALNIGNGTRTGIFNHKGGIANIGNLTINATGANAYTCSTTGPQTINISGNWINSKTFTAGTSSTVNFVGNSLQTITGTLSGPGGKFYNLTFNGVGGSWTNSAPIDVANTLTMSNGILNTTPINFLNITNKSNTGASNGTATSFVSGPIKWATTSNVSYAFPVGKGSTYLPFVLNTKGTTGTTAQVEAFDSNCGGAANYTNVGGLSNTEYWSLTTTGTFTNSLVSLSRPTSISPFDVIASSTVANGTYASLDGTVGANGITNSLAIGTNMFFTFGRKNGIRTGAISGSPFCAGTSVSVPYTIIGTYVAANTFAAQLSDAFGSFSTPINIGNITSPLAGTISATIPSGSAAGTKYRIRVISNTSPNNVIGEMNSGDLTITAINSATLTSGPGTNSQALCIGTSLINITFSTTGATGIGAATGLPAGVSSNFSSGVITLSGTPTASGTFNYSIPLSGGCGSVNATGTIKINAPTTYTSGIWSDGVPDINKKAIFATDYTTTSGQNINACSCEVKNGAVLRISINSTLTVQNEITNLGSGSNFIVESDGNLIQVNDLPTNSGSITSEREFTIGAAREQYNYLGTPVAFEAGQSYKTIFPGSTNTAVLYHNQATNTFSTSSGANVPGRGSAVKEPLPTTTLVGGKTTVQFRGVPQNGQITLGIANSNTGLTTLGYNLVGNPYASNIDLRKLYDINGGKTDPTQITSLDISPTFYFWDNSGNKQFQQQGSGYNGQSYAVFNVLTGGNGTGTAAGSLSGSITGTKKPTKIVSVGQGFMTRSLKTNYNFIFNNSVRTNETATPNFLGRGDSVIQDDRYWLKMTAPSGIISTITVVHYPGGNNFFGAEDSRSMGGSDAIYSLVENEKVAINGRTSLVNTDVIPLGSQFFTNGNYNIGIDTAEGIFANGQNIYLKDNQTGIITNLSAGNYTFGANAGESTGRFEIIYKPETVLATEGKVKDQLIVYKDGSDFVVKSKTKKITDIEVYDTAGRLICKTLANRNTVFISAEKFANGVYILKINQEGLVTSKKVIK